MKWLVQSGVTCACDIDPVYGIHVATSTTFFSDGSTCTGAPGGCANQVMQGNWSNMVPWNLVDPNANSGYGQGAGTSFPGTGQLNGQTPIGIWSVDNTFSFTYGGNDFGEPYIWFTQHNWVNNDPSQGCVPNPANCITPVFRPNIVINCCDPTEKYQVGGIDLIRMTGTPNLISPIPLGVVNYTEAFIGNFLNQPANPTNGPYPNETGFKCWHLGEEYPTFAPQANNMSFNLGLASGTWPGPVQKYTSCGDIPSTVFECCEEAPIECEPPFAKLAKLTSKLDNFIVWKNKSLGK